MKPARYYITVTIRRTGLTRRVGQPKTVSECRAWLALVDSSVMVHRSFGLEPA
jgi:hypothetical protein